MYFQHPTGEIARDQLAEIFNQLEFMDIRRLCQSNNTFRQICREKPFSHIVARKYDQHEEIINKGLDDYIKRYNSLNKFGTIIYDLGNNHTIRIIIRKYGGVSDDITAYEEAFNLPLNELILSNVLINEINMNIVDLDKLSKDELIDLYMELKYKSTGNMDMDNISERMQQKFDYNGTMRIFLERYHIFVVDGTRHKWVQFQLTSDEQLKFIIKSIYSDYSNPIVSVERTTAITYKKYI